MTPDEHVTPAADDSGGGARVFRVLVVPGVNPDRWLRVWRERLADVPLELVVVEPPDAEPALRAGDADVAILRLPVDRDALSAIPLYTEETVVVAARDHVFSVAEQVTPADLADETVVRPDDDLVRWTDAPGEPFAGGAVATTADAVDLVAAGIGVVLLPQSVARLHHRRGLVSRPVTDAPGSVVALTWLTDAHDDLTEEFIGIVRGRTAGSSRGRGTPQREASSTAEKGPGTTGRAGGQGASAARGAGGSSRRDPASGRSRGSSGSGQSGGRSGRSAARRPRRGR
ncbi:LysR family transcriptional regulator substrate-binding protein [Cellulomonas fimi]|uniref:LysR family transcriptional regulator substrate-binding protein n=1 Tax=Cellulomonas fimi TaxID=1708 RepID=UPI00234C7588|nr:LysR family transcriptional regulator substrate-binding protein [Cellulomonas fimi]MDC7121920.1 LysR family transcriptional regulator substrate-binding protein [Cellulomonas fimi]